MESNGGSHFIIFPGAIAYGYRPVIIRVQSADTGPRQLPVAIYHLHCLLYIFCLLPIHGIRQGPALLRVMVDYFYCFVLPLTQRIYRQYAYRVGAGAEQRSIDIQVKVTCMGQPSSILPPRKRLRCTTVKNVRELCQAASSLYSTQNVDPALRMSQPTEMLLMQIRSDTFQLFKYAFKWYATYATASEVKPG